MGDSTHFVKYGKRWRVGTSLLGVELRSYLMSKDGASRLTHFRKAFDMLWSRFHHHEWMDMQLDSWCNETRFTCIGHTRASKTFGLAHIIFLDWLAHPIDLRSEKERIDDDNAGIRVGSGTITSLSSMSLDRLRDTIGRDLLTAIHTCSINKHLDNMLEIRDSKNEFRVSLKAPVGCTQSEKERYESFCIQGLAINATKATKIQGRHADRRRLIGDETADFPDEYFLAEKNAESASDFRSVHLANPCERTSVFGGLCEPEKGWDSIDQWDKSWRARSGRKILHFHGKLGRNWKLYERLQRGEITQEEYEKNLWKFLITPEYINGINPDTKEYYMYVAGFFPPDGMVNSVFTSDLLSNAMDDIVFDFKPTRCAMLDPAYEKDNCVIHIGEHGSLRDGGYSINFIKTFCIDTQINRGSKPKEFQISEKIKSILTSEGVSPKEFIGDTTGNGRAVMSILEHDLGSSIHRCEFGGSSTERQLSMSDLTKCKDLYRYFVDELHFRAREWLFCNRVGGLKNLDKRTIEDLGRRRYDIVQNKPRIETKDELKKRIGRSPDFGDAFILFSELLARKGIYPSKFIEQVTNKVSIHKSLKDRAISASSIYKDEESFKY